MKLQDDKMELKEGKAPISVSILTPIYGVEKYIEQCARSLFEQTYANIEYIFVNDCTPDHSIEILESIIAEYPERARQAHVIHHPHNKGVGAARQTALMAAQGDYIMFVDSDDFLPVDAVEKLIRKEEEEIKASEAGKAEGDTSASIYLIDGGYAEWNNGKASLPQKPCHITGEKYLKLLICQNVINNRLWGRLYKRSLIMEHEIFFQEGINYAEDLFWNTQFLDYANQEAKKRNQDAKSQDKEGKCQDKTAISKVCLDEVVYYYRTDNLSSYTHDISEKNLLSYFKSSQLLTNFLAEQGEEQTYRTATDIGIVNAYRWAKNAKVSFDKVDALLKYKPKSLVIRLVIWLIKQGCPIKITNLLYLSYRRIYVACFC